MKVVHLELAEANDFVSRHHRHHKPVQGHRFSLGAQIEEKLVGVAIVGRPVARGMDLSHLEITRLCTDGTQNVCSFLYGACAKAGKALGYKRIHTYILDTESGISLKAAGFDYAWTTAGGYWKHTDGKERRKDQPSNKKQLWWKFL